jgi:hypothetical protein
MRCEEFELALLSEEPLSAEAQAHAAACPGCAAFRDEVPGLLADAALPELSLAERARLDGLVPSLLAAQRTQTKRRAALRQAVSLALAASLGAVVASAVVLKLRPVHAAHPAVPMRAAAPSSDVVTYADLGFELPAATDDGSDVDSLEVSWPSPTEGDVP